MLPASVHLVGLGGIGGYLLQTLCSMLPADSTLHLYDGDKFEKKNMDRQLCVRSDMGKNKAEALGPRFARTARCKVVVHPEYLTGNEELPEKPLLIAAVDNHPARASTLMLADLHKGAAILAGNEQYSSEAYYYKHEWAGTPLDPRVYYPELLTSADGDPLHPGCAGVLRDTVPQTIGANFNAAGQVLHLMNFWYIAADTLNEEGLSGGPVHSSQTLTKQFGKQAYEYGHLSG